MDLKSLQKELFEKKLETMDYFGVGFDGFGILLRENKMLMLFSFILIFFKIVLVISMIALRREISIGWYDREILLMLILIQILYLILKIIEPFFKGYFFRKVAFKFENNTNGLKLDKLFIKSLILLGISIIIELISYVSQGLTGILAVIITIWALLYFSSVYYIRDLGFMESLNRSLELSSGNRLRMVIPLIFEGMIFGIGIVIMLLAFMGEMPFGVLLLILAILFTIAAIIMMYMQILNILIFLNIENDYLKKEWRDSNSGNRQVINEVLSDKSKSKIENDDKGLE